MLLVGPEAGGGAAKGNPQATLKRCPEERGGEPWDEVRVPGLQFHGHEDGWWRPPSGSG